MRKPVFLLAALAIGLAVCASATAQPPDAAMRPSAPHAPGFWGGPLRPGPGGPGGGMGPGMHRWVDFHLGMAERLGLNDTQVAKLRAQKLEFDKARVQRRAAVQTAEIELEALKTTEPVAVDKVEAKIREVFAKRAEEAVATFAAQVEADKVLTPEQLAQVGKPGHRPGPWKRERVEQKPSKEK